jgi:hypothetical protein
VSLKGGPPAVSEEGDKLVIVGEVSPVAERMKFNVKRGALASSQNTLNCPGSRIGSGRRSADRDLGEKALVAVLARR